jgi:hypothetical protein
MVASKEMDVAGGVSTMLYANSRAVEENDDDADDELNADTRIDGRRRNIIIIVAVLLIIFSDPHHPEIVFLRSRTSPPERRSRSVDVPPPTR